ncbi:hypothetical protein BUZ11_11175 [Staphylococcus gallinarum]|uniref:hypothetical protein n=1 Tax=Staphylococcus gallinarum TaxID=1293 RepID=UPI000D1C966C|nr:hypothetical protein [Staphylococcus gallinarum]PTE33715.1 hypothetical protein BUZ00_10020 [Staphylococcus gallinarum]PTK89107.1 hypothetical protein BUZ03_12000 [Staphylococcus gallinarum]PTK90657.1 hypothetical protein BUZ05_10335 [Staphylococcus gallinarum]PTK94743.1 hypothetical protein BUZ13_03915 [Staphylococcus gallinarum]PTL07186.1 hypothetical protein BUZ09_09220 [Staphylococcus gallinarum]
MKDRFIFRLNGYLYPFVMWIFVLYLTLISAYSARFIIQLKTLNNIESYYDRQLNSFDKKGDTIENK